MTGLGRPAQEIVDADGLSLAIVVTRWNAAMTDLMLDRAIAAATACNAAKVTLERVAGAIEVPVVAQELAKHYDAVVALAAVVRGETPHFDYVCQSITVGLTQAALSTSTPIGNGILTCNTQQEAFARAGGPGSMEDKGWEAVIAALDVAITLRRIRSQGGSDGGSQASPDAPALFANF